MSKSRPKSGGVHQELEVLPVPHYQHTVNLLAIYRRWGVSRKDLRVIFSPPEMSRRGRHYASDAAVRDTCIISHIMILEALQAGYKDVHPTPRSNVKDTMPYVLDVVGAMVRNGYVIPLNHGELEITPKGIDHLRELQVHPPENNQCIGIYT